MWTETMNKGKTAVIFGITGMDGSHLADLLLEKGYNVYGVARRTSTNNTERIAHLLDETNFHLVSGDITDYSSILNVLRDIVDVDEIYNLAAQSHVGESFKTPGVTWDITGKGCMNILQAIVDLDMLETRFYQASSSEMFGSAFTANCDGDCKDYDLMTDRGKIILSCTTDFLGEVRTYQDENTKFLPQSPYAIAKCAAHMSVRLYREAYGLHASCGILFNHEGPRRGENFVTRKITKWLGEYTHWINKNIEEQEPQQGEPFLKFDADRIYFGQNDLRGFSKLRLGNLEAKRDWGHAKDYVRAMYLMLQQESPNDYVICTEETRSIKDFLDVAFDKALGDSYENYVVIDPQFYRPAEVDFLLGDCSKAKEELGWSREYYFEDLVTEMVNYDTHKTNETV